MQREVIDKTREWISKVVIDLGLCPFAKRVFDAEMIRYAVTETQETSEVLDALKLELKRLASAPRESIETSFLIFPNVLSDFLDFNDFTSAADEVLGNAGYRGDIQLVGFHPRYQFQGTRHDSPENYTNRSPYPMFHLLREISISELKLSSEELLEIPKRNIETLKKLGLPQILNRLKAS